MEVEQKKKNTISKMISVQFCHCVCTNLIIGQKTFL